MKFILSCLILVFCTSSNLYAAKTLGGYADLLQALRQGDNVRAIIYLEQCETQKTTNKTELSLREIINYEININFDIFSHYKVIDKGYEKLVIGTAHSAFVAKDILGPVYVYLDLRVFNDNTTEFYVKYFDAKSYEQIFLLKLLCPIGNKKNQNGVVLFDKG